jgi:hypothetical protein
MTHRWTAACALILVAGACGRNPLTATTDLVGQYVLTGFDGSRNLPCCSQTDTSGAVVSIAGGVLQIGWYTPRGTYEWDLVRTYDYPDMTSRQEQSRFSSGTYTWDGQTLKLMDSNGLGPMTGSARDNIVTVGNQDEQYEFLRLIPLPH